MTTPTETQIMIKDEWFTRVDLVYGVLGLVFLAQVGAHPASWKSFALGFVLAEINFELIKRIATMLLALYQGSQKLGFASYGLIVGKFVVWGMIFLICSNVRWLQ